MRRLAARGDKKPVSVDVDGAIREEFKLPDVLTVESMVYYLTRSNDEAVPAGRCPGLRMPRRARTRAGLPFPTSPGVRGSWGRSAPAPIKAYCARTPVQGFPQKSVIQWVLHDQTPLLEGINLRPNTPTRRDKSSTKHPYYVQVVLIK